MKWQAQIKPRPGPSAAGLLLILAFVCLAGCSTGPETVLAGTPPGATDHSSAGLPQPGDAMLAPTTGPATTPPVTSPASAPSNLAPKATRTPKVATSPTQKATRTAQAASDLPAGVTLPTPLPGERLATVHFGQLPGQARAVIALIAAGGPFPYRQDGVVFQNREGVLPHQGSAYYHEFTVETPGSPDRGARRIITGSQGQVYYTDDHYASFRRVVP